MKVAGRICRVDTEFAKQYLHILEVVGTIDTYKQELFKDNVGLINELFEDNGVLPTDIILRDRTDLSYRKRRLLWNKRR